MDNIDVTDKTTSVIDVFDATGKRVFSGCSVAPEALLKHRMDLNDLLHGGTYTASVLTWDQRFIQRLVMH